MARKDPIAALEEVSAANRLTAASMLETARSQRRGTQAMIAAGRAVREMVEINLRAADRINAACDSVQQVNRDIKNTTDTANAVASSLQEQERNLRAIITPPAADEPATLSLTSDAVAFTPEADERIVRKILALEPEKPTLN